MRLISKTHTVIALIAITMFMSTLTHSALAATDSNNAFTKKAKTLTQQYMLIDGHIDLPYRLREQWEETSRTTKHGDFDYPRALIGGLNTPFMSIYIPASYEASGGAKALADSLIDSVEAMVYRAPDKFVIVKSADTMQAAMSAAKIGLALGIENGSAIEGDLDNVEHFYQRGVRYITLTHSLANHISDSSYDSNHLWNGLSPFGFQLLTAMNNTGIMIDISHVSDAAFYDVIKTTKTPVIASHSSLRHFVPGFERNMNDDMVKALGKNGGVLMVNFASTFISQTAQEQYALQKAATKSFKEQHGLSDDDAKVKAFVEQYRQKYPFPYASIQQVADHIDRIKMLAGISTIGIGSDYDGVGDSLPEGLKDVSSYPNLVAELLKRKYSDSDIEKILGGNLLRVLTQVERYAATH